MTSKRLKRRGWMQFQAIQVLNHGDDYDASTILNLIKEANPSETRRGWCNLTPVSLGKFLRQLVTKGVMIRTLQSNGIYSYKLATDNFDMKLEEFLRGVVMYSDRRNGANKQALQATLRRKDPNLPLDP